MPKPLPGLNIDHIATRPQDGAGLETAPGSVMLVQEGGAPYALRRRAGCAKTREHDSYRISPQNPTSQTIGNCCHIVQGELVRSCRDGQKKYLSIV